MCLNKKTIYNCFVCVNFSYHIEYLAGEMTYWVKKLNISVCYNADMSCDVIAPVLTNTLLPRDLCPWNTEYLITGKQTL